VQDAGEEQFHIPTKHKRQKKQEATLPAINININIRERSTSTSTSTSTSISAINITPHAIAQSFFFSTTVVEKEE